MDNTYSSWLPRWAQRRLGALILLLATIGVGHAQAPVAFSYTGSPNSYTVPAGITAIQVVARGAGGGTYSNGAAAVGAQVQATLAVTPGEQLTVVVGGQGATGNATTTAAGGYNGGGTGNLLGGGGGATDLRRTSSRTDDYLSSRNALLVAGGGGGGGDLRSNSGGNGGTPTGGDGLPTSAVTGNGASQTAPGSGSNAGTNGTGGNGPTNNYNAGGGGGYYGGGASYEFGGGGGGSSFVTTLGSTSISYSLAPAASDGSLTITPVATSTSIIVQYQTADLGQPLDGQVRPMLQLVNTGTTAVPYASLTVRYWLTPENFLGQLVTPIDWARIGTSFVSARYVALPTPRQGAFGYIEYSFAAGAGNLAAGTDSGPIYGKAHKPDYSDLDETDDWSYQPSGSFTTNNTLTLYQNGVLIAGAEPPAVAAQTALQVYSASRDASPSTSYVSVQLHVRSLGNVPVNYGDLKARYYFTRDGATGIVPQVDYAKLGASNLSVSVVNLATAVSGADAYVEISFAPSLGTFYPRSSTDDIFFKLRKSDYSALDQTNDYAFTASTALALNNLFPAYLGGTLVFGIPPFGAPALVAASSSSASAGGATIVAARGPLALTASPNPFAEQLTLRFALSTTQAYSLALYDGQGRLMQPLASGEAPAERTQEVAVPTQAYAAGLYLVRLTTASGVQTLKLVKQ